MLLLALPYLTNGISVKGTICVIIRVELEEGLAPVMRAIAFLPIAIRDYRNMFCALQIGILMPVVQDLMAAPSHHLCEFDNLLRVGAGVKCLA